MMTFAQIARRERVTASYAYVVYNRAMRKLSRQINFDLAQWDQKGKPCFGDLLSRCSPGSSSRELRFLRYVGFRPPNEIDDDPWLPDLPGPDMPRFSGNAHQRRLARRAWQRAHKLGNA